MNNFSWIRDLYQFEKPGTPNPRFRLFATLTSLSVGMWLYIKIGNFIPLSIAILIGLISISKKASEVFFGSVHGAIVFLFHTLDLLALTFFFYLFLTPLAWLHRVFRKEDLFYRCNVNTIDICENKQIQFERQF